MIGKVKSFSFHRGYGFIDCEGRDVFFHWSDLEMDGYRSIRHGKIVEFKLLKTDKGLRAQEIKMIKKDVL